MDTKEIFSKRLFQLRESKGLSRQAVADDLDITRASLEYYEKGMRTPNLETIFKISEYYQVSIDYLFGKIDNASKNVNTALISDYLGLSEDSIFGLHELSEKDKKIINFFIQSNELYDILYQFNDFEKNLSKAANELKTFYEKYPDYDYWTTSSNYNELEIAKEIKKTNDNTEMFFKFAQVNTYEAQRIFLAIMKRYCDSSFEKYNEMLEKFKSMIGSCSVEDGEE